MVVTHVRACVAWCACACVCVCMCVPRVAKDDDLQQHLLARRHREAPGSCTDKATAHTSVIVLVPRRLQPTHAQVDKVQERRLQSPAPPARRAVATLDFRPCSCTPTLPCRHAATPCTGTLRQAGSQAIRLRVCRSCAALQRTPAAQFGLPPGQAEAGQNCAGARPAAMPSFTIQTCAGFTWLPRAMTQRSLKTSGRGFKNPGGRTRKSSLAPPREHAEPWLCVAVKLVITEEASHCDVQGEVDAGMWEVVGGQSPSLSCSASLFAAFAALAARDTAPACSLRRPPARRRVHPFRVGTGAQ